MEIKGKCKIANKWLNGQVDKSQFDFENKGKIAVGRLSWSDVIKGKDGAKDTFISTTKKFICFGENIDFIANNVKSSLEIAGRLKSEEFQGQDGKKVKYDVVVISDVKLAEANGIDKHQVAKGNGYQRQEELDDSLPW